MTLAVLINNLSLFTCNPDQKAGTILVDGVSHDFGENPVTFAAELVTRGRASSVSIKGSSVAEFVAALIMLGIQVKGEILSTCAVRARSTKGSSLERMRAGLKSGPAMVQFAQRLCDGGKRPHIQVGTTRQPVPGARPVSPVGMFD